MKQTITLNVEGMSCSHCENRLNNAIKTLKGVKSVKADHTTKTVTVTINNKVDINDIKNIISDTGYNVKD